MEKYLTSEQVATLLQVHPFTVLKYLKSGTLEGVKIGRVYRIRESDVEKFLNHAAIAAHVAIEPEPRARSQKPIEENQPEPEPTHELKFQDDEEKSSPSYYQVL